NHETRRVFYSRPSPRIHLSLSDVWQPMKKTLLKVFDVVLAFSLFVGMISRAGAVDYVGYSALDQSQPISFDGKTVKWNSKTFALDENTLFLDYRLDRAKLVGNPFAFNTLKDAAKALKNGTAEKPCCCS